jgi:hypothetical protein
MLFLYKRNLEETHILDFNPIVEEKGIRSRKLKVRTQCPRLLLLWDFEKVI